MELEELGVYKCAVFLCSKMEQLAGGCGFLAHALSGFLPYTLRLAAVVYVKYS